MANGLQLNNSTVFAGLGTASYTVVTSGLYTVEFKATIPYRAAGTAGYSDNTTGASALQVVVNLNGSPVLTVANPSSNQPLVGGVVSIGCVATDVITVVLTSSAVADAAPNAVKTTINLFQGE